MSLRAPRSVMLLVVAVVGAVALGIGACGTDTIKAGQVETNIRKEYAARGVALTDVACEGGVEARVGEALSCTALNPSRTRLALKGRVTAVRGGRIEHQVFNAVSGVARGEVVAQEMLRVAQDRIGDDARTLSCPAEVPIPTKGPVTCALVKSDGRTYDAKGSIDERSRLSLEVAAQPR